MQSDTGLYMAVKKFAESVVITDEVIAAIEECNDLAPLHNPANFDRHSCMYGTDAGRTKCSCL